MIVTSLNKTIEYGCTPAGQFFEKTSCNKGSVIKTSTDPQALLKWLLGSVIADEIKQENKEFNLMKCIGWWEMQIGHFHHGSFNLELYKKVLKAKSNASKASEKSN